MHEEDENDGNDHHPERHRTGHDHDDGGLGRLFDNVADILEEVADLLRDLF